MPRNSKYRKTRRHLKSRRQRRTRRLRRQCGGGAGPSNVEEWVNAARDKFREKAVTGITVLGDLMDDDLKLPSTVEPGSEDRMKFIYTQGDNDNFENSEDIRDTAKLIYASLISIVGQENLDSVTPAEFKKALAAYPSNPDRIGDDTVSTTLDYLLDCENSLRNLAAFDKLPTSEGPINALNNNTEPLFIWALAINNAKEPVVPSLFIPEVMHQNLSEPK